MRQRHTIILPAALKNAANQAAHLIGIDPVGTLETFACPLVHVDGPGDAEASHYVASGQVSEEIRQWLEANQGSFPGTRWWRIYDAGPNKGEIVATNTEDEIGGAFDLAESLSNAGLKRRVTPNPMNDHG